MVFKVGETVVYPHHGAALIEAIETRVIKGEEKKYLVLKVAQGDLTVRVPADNAEIVGVRDVVGQEGLDKVFDVLRAPHTEEPTNWSRRYKANLEKHASDGELALTPVHGEALLTHTVRGLLGVPEISSVLVAAPQRCALSFSQVLGDLPCRVVPGTPRQAFAAVEADLPPDSVVLLHDALRAFIPAETVREVINAVGDASVVVPVLPMADTVKVTESSFIVGTEDRSRLRTLQTPIGYTLDAFRAADLSVTAPAGAATVPGHPDAMRVTTGFELSLAEAIAAAPTNEETL